MRAIYLLGLFPVTLFVLAVSFWFLPPSLLTPFNSWILIEGVLGVAFLVSIYLSNKYGLAREMPFIIAGLAITLVMVLSYISLEVQRLAFTITALASCGLYYRVIVEFKRREYA